MERNVIVTGDGSTTIHLSEWDEHYHSKHGAIQEAYHVFIESGLSHLIPTETQAAYEITILEIGFGTGLNALITYLESKKKNLKISYVGVEAYPVSLREIEQLNYSEALQVDKKVLQLMHEVSWGKPLIISEQFQLTKLNKRFETIDDKEQFQLIYFDAFGARVQPELWTEAIFEKMYQALKADGVLVTYSAKGSVRRAMQAVGFKVEKLPGPPGKREMLRATKGI